MSSIDIQALIAAAVQEALQGQTAPASTTGAGADTLQDPALQAEHADYVARVARSGHGATPRTLPDYVAWRLKSGKASAAVKAAAQASPEQASPEAVQGRKAGDLIVHWHGASKKYGDRRFSIGGPEAYYLQALTLLRGAGLPVAPDREQA